MYSNTCEAPRACTYWRSGSSCVSGVWLRSISADPHFGQLDSLPVFSANWLRQAYASAIAALAIGRAEAKLIFRHRAEVQRVELVVLEYRRSPIFAEFINRKRAPRAHRMEATK